MNDGTWRRESFLSTNLFPSLPRLERLGNQPSPTTIPIRTAAAVVPSRLIVDVLDDGLDIVQRSAMDMAQQLGLQNSSSSFIDSVEHPTGCE
jgi:hypothetical protein